MQVSGSPASAPSRSQNGKAGSVQVPSWHDFGFGRVQDAAAASTATTTKLVLHKDITRCSMIIGPLSTKATAGCVRTTEMCGPRHEGGAFWATASGWATLAG